ncbi:MAG: hypothetical protein DRO87_04250 [Candidatus Thorarchaeota archaeon]|nr:MAG: hypothetical protein DRP09_09320 [Candidatus Thorarchaeota archaeon]RLI58975.1 MAG: hypothetical protein DRO87_04250 [Candidatus Thorarchaeota archaeon]
MEYDFKTLIQYLSSIALAIFFLIYLPWTYLSSALAAMGPILVWVYYFSLVLGLLFPMYYAIEKENMSWICLGLGLILNSIIWFMAPYAAIDTTSQQISATLVLLTGVLFFLAPFLENRVGNWDLVKNLFHFLKGLFLTLAVGFFAGWNLDAFIGTNSMNHVMPQFIFMGGGIMIAFAVVLMVYGLFKLFKMYIPGRAGEFFGDLAKIFYMLMVLIFLFGIVFNATSYISLPFGVAATNPWSVVTFGSSSIEFFSGLFALGLSNLGAILMLILFIYGMGKIAEKYSQ